MTLARSCGTPRDRKHPGWTISSLGYSVKAMGQKLDLDIPEARDEMVVDQAGALHESVADGGAHKAETALDQVAAHRR